jgi:hypothetical protein
MVLDGEVTIGSGNEHLTRNSAEFCDERLLVALASNVLDNSIASRNVERFVGKWQARIGLYPNVGAHTVGINKTFARPYSRGRDLSPMGIVAFNEVRTVVDNARHSHV